MMAVIVCTMLIIVFFLYYYIIGLLVIIMNIITIIDIVMPNSKGYSLNVFDLQQCRLVDLVAIKHDRQQTWHHVAAFQQHPLRPIDATLGLVDWYRNGRLPVISM
jgi:hypothetical protein